MKSDKETKKGLSRRDFIKTTTAGVGATALAGLGARSAKAAGLPDRWDKEADVVVVGCGGAGTTAAITAHDAGSKVIILEKAPEGGGNSRVGGAQFSYSIPEKKDDAATYLYAACNGTTPKDVCQAWADEMVHNREWLDKMGVAYTSPGDNVRGGDFQGFPGAGSIGTGLMTGYGIAWYEVIEKQIRDRGIDVMYNSPATELIQDCTTKEILGVKVNSEGRDKFIKARKGVVLCSGGFEFNEDMKKNYLRPTSIKFTGWIYNTGDGIKMAQAVGADLWHMNMICSAGYTIITPESEMGWMYPEPKGSNFILVTKYGERFMREGAWFAHRTIMGYSLWDWRGDRKDSEYPCCPHYMIFDETTRLAGPVGINETSMFTGMGNSVTPKWLGGYSSAWGETGAGWSQDNSAEIAKGWIMKANTIGELADKIGGEMTADNLTATVERWNGFCDAGVDSDFGRTNARGGMPGGASGARGGAGGGPEGAAPSGGREGAPGGGREGAPGGGPGGAGGGPGGASGGARGGGGSASFSFFSRNLEKIETPPFYAIELWPGGFSTCGGPKKNAKGQIMGVDGKPIERLYEAGSLGHTCGQVYSMSGANYCECFVWGRISGRNVAALRPWTEA